MSFSLLPTELVRQIIESSVPSNFDIDTYEERQATLCAISLISRRFCQIAQPLLFQVVWINSFQEMDTVLDIIETKNWKHILREVFIKHTNPSLHAADALSGLARNGQGLRSLILYLPLDYPLDLSALSTLPNLVKLQLGGAGFFFSKPLVFDKLHSLEITRSNIEIVNSVLNPKTIPSLRRLAFVDIMVDFELNALFETPFPELLPKLETFYLNEPVPLPIPAFFFPAFNHTRFDCRYDDPDTFGLLRAGAQHIQITGLDNGRQGREVDDLSGMISYIQNANPLRLRSICLARRFWNDQSSTPEQLAVLEAFTRVCEERNIEIYQEQAQTMVYEAHISEKFAEVLKGIKERDQKEKDKPQAKE
ncbi:hypothetical protein JCM5353_007001 [Sporobolomyces roseus]